MRLRLASEQAAPPGLPPVVWRAGLPLVAGALLALLPAPDGLAPQAWRYFAAFTAVIVAVVTEPIALAGVGLVGVIGVALAGLPFSPAQLADPGFRLPAESLKFALAGFSNGTVWLVFGAFVLALGYEKTGLGRRIALVLVKHLGGRTIGLGYALALSDLLLAPLTPSNTARSAGAIFPVARSIPEVYACQPGGSSRAIGAYVMWVAFATTSVTSSMFVTAVAPNLLAIELVRGATGIEITWTDWFVGFLPIGAPLLIAVPWLSYRLCPPDIRASDEVPRWAEQELTRLGRITSREITMAGLVIVALGLWIFGSRLIDTTMVALLAISLMLVFGVVSWPDIAGNASAWNVFVWFATLLVLADGLNKVGFVEWFGRGAAAQLADRPPLVVMTTLVALYFVLHYMFASVTAHTSALLPVMIAAGASVPGMPLRPFVLLLVFSQGLMGVLTPYATGPAPVYFGSGYVSRRDFWKLGFVFGLVFLCTLLLVGVPYLRAMLP